MDPRQHQGVLAERLAALHLQLHGIEVLQHNLICAGVQVDLVARDGARLLVVEVKLRRRHAGFTAVQALGAAQRGRLRRAAQALFDRCAWAHSVRIDVVGIDWQPHSHHLIVEHLQGIG